MRAVLPFVIMLGVAVCGREPDVAASASGKPANATTVPGAEDSVAAVVQSPGKPSVSLRFALGDKPRIGAATSLRLDLAGTPGELSVRLHGEGLVPDPSALSVTIGEDGRAASQSVAVTAHVAGIAELVVRVQPLSDGAQEVVYAIPLLVEAAAAK